MTTEVNEPSTSAAVATAINGSVEALENATYIPQSIMVTGGAGTLFGLLAVLLCINHLNFPIYIHILTSPHHISQTLNFITLLLHFISWFSSSLLTLHPNTHTHSHVCVYMNELQASLLHM
jgi:hypothetical protein